MDRGTTLIRRDTDYALRALIHLAGQENGGVPGTRLAEACGIPRSFAYKILKRMCNEGIVASRTGRNGGFRLGRDPKRIFLSDVITAVQGSVGVSLCVLDPDVCRRSRTCALSAEWRKVQRQLTAFLDDTSVYDLLRSSSKRASGRRRK